jgi:hypothetical protein
MPSCVLTNRFIEHVRDTDKNVLPTYQYPFGGIHAGAVCCIVDSSRAGLN